VDTLLQDLRYAARTLTRSPGFTLVAVFTLALGIGANTAIFSVVNAVLLRPLPYAEPERLASAGWLMRGDYLVARERSRSFEELALYRASVGFNLSAAGEPERVTGAHASPDLFSILGVAPLLGRTLLAHEERPGEDGVVVLSHALWRQRFGGDPAVVGREVMIDSEPRTVVGVMPPGFDFPAGDALLWVPLPLDPADPVALWGGGGGQSLGRLRAGVTPAQAQAEIRALASEMREANTLWTPPPEYGMEREVTALQEQMVGEVRTRLLVALGAVGLVLLIACANVANLMLARAAARRKEVAIRTALGAGRFRLIRQLLTESTLLALLGGAAGLALAFGGVRLLIGGLPADTPRVAEIGIDVGVLGFAAAVTLLTGLLFGLFPALRTSRQDLHAALRGGRGASEGAGQRRLSSALVAGEVALAVVLVIGAGLLIRSFWTLLRVDPGFRVESIVSARITPPEIRYGQAAQQRAFYGELLARTEALPGVSGAALVDRLPLVGGFAGLAFEVEGQPFVPGTAAPMVETRRITPDYLRLMGIPLLSGRPLADADREGAPDVALINEAMARQHWPGEDPVGRRFKPVWWQNRWITVVGVVADVRQYGLASAVEPEMYRPFAQEPAGTMMLVARTAAEPPVLAANLRSTVAAVDPEVPVSEVLTLEQVVSRSVAAPRFTMLLLAVFAAVALLLGAVGIYGVVAYSVTRRTREIGVRMALGARVEDVARLVIGQGLLLTLVGVAIGLVVALAATRVLSSLLYGIEPTDPVTFLAVPLLLTLVALLASYLPARRATRVDPLVALRAD
jgi:putative ABC transport system permease protein